jgi:hypothetical protein
MARKRLSAATAERIRELAKNRCGYCLSPQHLVHASLEIEHLQPVSQGGSDADENLWLSCPLCNGHKSDKTTGIDPHTGREQPLFNPRLQNWSEHFRWTDDGLRIAGRTPIGRTTVATLRLDSDLIAIEVRSFWVAAGWHPPES